MSDVEETLKRIQSQKNVAGVIVMDSSGRAIRSTLDDEATQQHCILLHQLCDKSKSVIRELDGSNDLTFLRLRTRKHEIMIAPDKDFLLAVIQNISAQFWLYSSLQFLILYLFICDNKFYIFLIGAIYRLTLFPWYKREGTLEWKESTKI